MHIRATLQHAFYDHQKFIFMIGVIIILLNVMLWVFCFDAQTYANNLH